MEGCFAAGAMLRTPTGLKAIEEFAPGDEVLSQDEHDPRSGIVTRRVEEVFRRYAMVLGVYLRREGEASPFVVRSTSEHPFYVSDPVYLGRWVAAGELQAGMWVLCDDGAWARVEEVHDSGEWEVVYNMRVADSHTYFVGESGRGYAVWVHNAYVILYQYAQGQYPPELRHWSIEIVAENERINTDLKNGTAGQPTGNDAKILQNWIDWANRDNPKAYVRKLDFEGPLKISSPSAKRIEIPEEVAVSAIAEVKRLVGETKANPWKWSLYGESCFELIAKILRIALPNENLPGKPGDAAGMQRLLSALNAIMERE